MSSSTLRLDLRAFAQASACRPTIRRWGMDVMNKSRADANCCADLGRIGSLNPGGMRRHNANAHKTTRLRRDLQKKAAIRCQARGVATFLLPRASESRHPPINRRAASPCAGKPQKRDSCPGLVVEEHCPSSTEPLPPQPRLSCRHRVCSSVDSRSHPPRRCGKRRRNSTHRTSGKCASRRHRLTGVSANVGRRALSPPSPQ